MIDIPWHPSSRSLRQFAGIWFPLFCAVVGTLAGRATGAWHIFQIFWALAGLVAIAGLVHPPAIRPVFVGLIVVTYPIGWIVSHVLLAGIFYLVVTPIGLGRRLCGHDKLALRGTKNMSTMWSNSVATTQIKQRYTQPY